MRRVALVGALMVGAVALGACGDDDGGGGGDEESAEARACADAPQFAFGLVPGVSAAAALPPEPIEELLPDAQTIVTGEVTEVLYEGEPPPTSSTDEPITGPIPPDRCQVVRLEVDEVLLGDVEPGAELVLVKPEAPYELEQGDAEDGRPYLVDGAEPYPVILGRYGPGNYGLGEVEQALSEGGA